QYTDTGVGSAFGAAALAVAHHRLGHAEEARRWLARTEDLNATMMRVFASPEPVRNWYGAIEHAAAYRWAATVVTGQRPPPDPLERLYRSRMYARLGDKAKAKAEFAGMTQTRPNDPEVWIAVGQHFLETGDTKGAEQALTRAATLAPDHLDRFLDLGW